MMRTDYHAIRLDNTARYGTDIGRIGPMLLANRYDDRTHFIFELLQNAEDALTRRPDAIGTRAVTFHLTERELKFSHFGRPFDEQDVRGICGIGQSTKGLTGIGRFGIGFKSVYAFTDRPEIHSGGECFAIENFVSPVEVPAIDRTDDQTVIIIPIEPDSPDRKELILGLQRLGAGTLLFLRQIEEIEWTVDGGPSGLYLRSKPEHLGGNARRVTLVGHTDGSPDTDDSWLVFAKPVTTSEGDVGGNVEVALQLAKDEVRGRERIVAVSQSPLVVFFPTVLETHLGFLVQGPYRTTPSRDNVPRHDPWNEHCVEETASVLREALPWLRNHDFLDASTLRCLPIDATRFGDTSMFAPLFKATKSSLGSERLLPCHGGGHEAAAFARMARTHELRELVAPDQLGTLFGGTEPIAWLTADISQDKTPDLRHYLIQELNMPEITPESFLSRLTLEYLEKQSDEWTLGLYEFLSGLPAMWKKAALVPLIRLENGTHIIPHSDGRQLAFLQSPVPTSFPTVRASVSRTEGALAFLRGIGLTEPDPVDDVIWHILPKYSVAEVDVTDTEYETDIQHVLTAFQADSKEQHDKLVAALRRTSFVMAVDAGDAGEYVEEPGMLYLPTDRLRELFVGVAGVEFVDHRYQCLRGEAARVMLESCGAVRHLRAIEDSSLSWEEKKQLREKAGHAETSGQRDHVTDWSLVGLRGLLSLLPKLEPEARQRRANLLWDELTHLEERRGKAVFTGAYTWTHYGSYEMPFDASFVRLLNSVDWVPDADGELCRPSNVLFESLGWKENPFLLSKIRFKPPILDQLAEEAGIEPGVIQLLQRHGVTSVSELRALLGLQQPSNPAESLVEGDRVAAAPHEGDEATSPPGARDNGVNQNVSTPTGKEHLPGTSTSYLRNTQVEATEAGGPSGSHRAQPMEFVSYVAVHPETQEERDPDGLTHAVRMQLESRAIAHILMAEPSWQRTPPSNSGFDLFDVGPDGQATRWCEVKAMTGSLQGRPVGLSRTQFEFARSKGADYWLYVVENAASDTARIVRIQDPAGRSVTFTFDRGWLSVAEVGDR